MPFKKGSRFPLDQIVSDYKQGMAIKKISRKYGCSLGGVYYHLLKKGLISPHGKEWHKLVHVPHSHTRLISIPSFLLSKAGFDPANELVARWHVEGQRLVLEIKRKED
jgi:hypothetical protein